MKVYTCFTPSHKVFYDNYFLPSLPTDDDIELVSEEFPQECSGEFMSSGWNDTMERKVNSFIRATKENWGRIFIYSDCDIQFFRPFTEDCVRQLGPHDIAAQIDYSLRGLIKTICAGFLVCRGNERNLALFEAMLANLDRYGNDQKAINKLKSKYISSVYLDRRYMSIHHLNGGKMWRLGDPVPKIPHDVIFHHANFADGLAAKIALLDAVKAQVAANRLGDR